MSDMHPVTPLRAQYLSIKQQHPKALLFFRLGDFYEFFDEDAETAARELDLVLTSRPISKSQKTPMCGVPYHAVDMYIARLVEKGYRVAVCEQLTQPNGRGLVERDVTRIIEPTPTPIFANLPAAQQVFLQALAAGDPVKKNAATRAALRRHHLITPDDDWTAIHLTDLGRSLLPQPDVPAAQPPAESPAPEMKPAPEPVEDGSALAKFWGTDVQLNFFGDHRPMPLKQLQLL